MMKNITKNRSQSSNPSPQLQKEFGATKVDRKQPGIIHCTNQSVHYVIIQWNEPTSVEKTVQHYQIKYQVKGENKWLCVETETKSNSFQIEELKSNTCYKFKVRAIFDNDEEGPFSEISADINTKQSVSENILCEDWKIKDGQPSLYKLPLSTPEETVNRESKIRQWSFGKTDGSCPSAKTIMFVGETGSGKSTLIDRMVNYILDVGWNDPWRFTITDHERVDQTKSQTDWITCYTIHRIPESQLDYTLNIIDTPGFGNTQGTESDEALAGRIINLFTTPPPKGIPSVDAVCFVTPASLARLTPQQTSMFNTILSIFGYDISKNIFVLITFADSKDPPVKYALQTAQIPCETSFQFNNSKLLVNKETSNGSNIRQRLWKMGTDNCKVFFTELSTRNANYLQLTARYEPEAIIQRLMPTIMRGLNVINTIKQEKRIVKNHLKDIESNKTFKYQVEEIIWRKVDLAKGTQASECLICNMVCHINAQNYDDIQCTECPKRCGWSKHRNRLYAMQSYSDKCTRTIQFLKRKYNIPRDNEIESSTVVKKVKEHLDRISTIVFAMIECARDCVNVIQKKDTKPNLLSQEEYIELLIDVEHIQCTKGWEERVEMLEAFMKQPKEIPSEGIKRCTDYGVLDLLQKYEAYEIRWRIAVMNANDSLV